MKNVLHSDMRPLADLHRWHFAFWGLLMALFSSISFAQDYYSIPEVLPTNQDSKSAAISCMETDPDGYLWLGTEKGLFRYSGTSYRAFYHTDSLSIASDYILALRQDRGKRMWVTSDMGVHLIENGVVKKNTPLDIGNIYGIANMDEERLLLSGKDGLYVFDKESGSINVAVRDKSFSYCHNIAIVLDMIFVISDDSHTVYSLDMGFNKRGEITFGKSTVNCIFPYMGMVVTSTSEGLFMLNPECRVLSLPERLQVFNGRDILFAKQDEYKSELVVGVKDVGIFRYYEPSGTLTRTWQNETLSGVSSCSCVVLRNNLAICKDGKSFSLSHDEGKETKTIHNLARSEKIMKIYPSDDINNSLILTDRDIYLFNLQTEESRKLTTGIIGEDTSFETAYMDPNYDVWIITDSGELVKYIYEKGGGTQRYTLGKTFEGDYSEAQFFTLPSGITGVVTQQRIFLFDEDGNTLSERKPAGTANNPYVAPDGTLYLYGKEGIFKAEPEGPITRIPLDVKAECMMVDNVGNFWVGTLNDGLCIYNVTSGETERLTMANGLPENTIRCILQFRNRVWVSCRNSIASISMTNRSIIPSIGRTGSSMNYSPNCGTVSEIIGIGNRIIFGSAHDLTILNPLYEEYRKDIHLSLESIQVLNEKISSNATDFVLSPKINNILFTFSAIDFDSGNRLNYEYMLEGFDDTWRHGGDGQSAGYTDLPGGAYNFRVRVKTPSGEYSSSEIATPFRIRKRFTSSYPFILLVILMSLATAGIVCAYFIYVRRLKENVTSERQTSGFFNKVLKLISNSPSFLNEEMINAVSLVYSPARELEKEKDLSPEARQQINLIARNVGRIKELAIRSENDMQGTFISVPLLAKTSDLHDAIDASCRAIEDITETDRLSIYNGIGKGTEGVIDNPRLGRILLITTWRLLHGEDCHDTLTLYSSISSADELRPEDTGGYLGRYLDLKFIAEDHNRNSLESRIADFLGRKTVKNEKDTWAPELATIKSLVDSHKGMLFPTSHGIRILIPCDKEAYELEETGQNDSRFMEEVKSRESIIEASFPENCTTLIAENDKSMRDHIADILRPRANVILATNGKDAYDLFEDNRIDFAIVDTSLPSMDGYTLCARIKNSKEGSRIPVMLISSDNSIMGNLRASDSGADAFLEKPFDSTLMLSRIATLLKNTDRLLRLASGGEQKAPIQAQKATRLSESDKAFLDRLSTLISENIGNESFSATTLAEKMEMSYSHFFTRTKEITGQSPKDLLLGQRLEKAMELLKEGKHNISEISYMVGFSSLGSFSRAFKTKYGVRPSSI